MKYALSDLQKKSDVDLIKLFRSEANEKAKSQIFNVIFFRKPSDRHYSWDYIIRTKARTNKQKSEYYNLGLDENDIYQEITTAFIKALTKWYDVNSMVACNAYLWRVIDSYANRLFQAQKTHKRSVCSNSIIKLNNMYDDNKTFDEIISSDEACIFKTLQRKDSIEKEFFFKNLITLIENIFKPLNINASEQLQKELLQIIQQGKTSERIFSNISTKFDIPLHEVIEIKNKLNDNLNNQMYLDIIKLMQKDIKDDGIIARKYNCSNCHITKLKRKLSDIVKKQLKKSGVSIHDYL